MNESQEPGLGLDAPAASRGSRAEPYRVLARKYRPTRFDDLIGQELSELVVRFEDGRNDRWDSVPAETRHL